jgi:hypothetical protein
LDLEGPSVGLTLNEPKLEKELVFDIVGFLFF